MKRTCCTCCTLVVQHHTVCKNRSLLVDVSSLSLTQPAILTPLHLGGWHKNVLPSVLCSHQLRPVLQQEPNNLGIVECGLRRTKSRDPPLPGPYIEGGQEGEVKANFAPKTFYTNLL